MSTWTRYAAPAALAALLLIGTASRAPAATELSEFRNSFDGWGWQWDIHRPAPYITPGVVTLDPARGFRDTHSLRFDMGNGAGDNGTLWIEKAFDVPPGVPTRVGVSFALFNQRYSDLNLFGVTAYAGEADPQVQQDHRRIGFTNRTGGWDPRFAHVTTVTSAGGRVWVAAGVSVAWETHRDYWIDHVRVSTGPILDGDADLDGRVDGSDFARLAANFGASFANWGWGDFTQDGNVDGRDFALLAANFGRGTAPGEVTAADWSALHAFADGAAFPVPEPPYAASALATLAALLARRPARQSW